MHAKSNTTALLSNPIIESDCNVPSPLCIMRGGVTGFANEPVLHVQLLQHSAMTYKMSNGQDHVEAAKEVGASGGKHRHVCVYVCVSECVCVCVRVCAQLLQVAILQSPGSSASYVCVCVCVCVCLCVHMGCVCP